LGFPPNGAFPFGLFCVCAFVFLFVFLDFLFFKIFKTGVAILNFFFNVLEKKILFSIERLEKTIANFCDYFGAQEKLGQGVTPILYEVQNQTEASAFTFSASSSCALEDLNISPQEYAEFVREYLPLAQKRKNGEQLSDPERKKLDELPFDKVALLVGAEGARDARDPVDAVSALGAR